MNAGVFYSSRAGRLLFQVIQKTGGVKAAAWFLNTKPSRLMIPYYIKHNHISLAGCEPKVYESFADFFARKKCRPVTRRRPDTLISPCDGLFSCYPVTEDTGLFLKGSQYLISDLVPDRQMASAFAGGLAMIFRLEAHHYHHFCFFADGELQETHFIPGQLHSVQPIACRSVPVYRLNRRWYHLMHTPAFGPAVQIEIGAMMVGGVTLTKDTGTFSMGEEMGNFELAGSTIVLLLTEDARRRLTRAGRLLPAADGGCEVPVAMGDVIGSL